MVRVVMVMMKMVKMMMVVMVTLITIVWYALCIVYRILIPNERFGLRELTGIALRWIFTWRCTIGCSWLPFSIFLLMLCQQMRKGTQQGYLLHWLLIGSHYIQGGIKCKQCIYIYCICCHIDIGEKDGHFKVGSCCWPILVAFFIGPWYTERSHDATNMLWLQSIESIWTRTTPGFDTHTHFTRGMITSKAVDHPLLICYCFMNWMWGPM